MSLLRQRSISNLTAWIINEMLAIIYIFIFCLGCLQAISLLQYTGNYFRSVDTAGFDHYFCCRLCSGQPGRSSPALPECRKQWKTRSRWARYCRLVGGMWLASPPPASGLELDWLPWGRTHTRTHKPRYFNWFSKSMLLINSLASFLINLSHCSLKQFKHTTEYKYTCGIAIANGSQAVV